MTRGAAEKWKPIFTVEWMRPLSGDRSGPFRDLSYEPAGGTPEEFGRLLAEEVATWTKVIRAAKIQFD